jgi:hypothetical protein
MMDRCYSKNHHAYPRYGGIGVRVCAPWHDFRIFQAWCFANEIDGCTLDRIDNNGHYCPENCKFSTRVEQQNNRHFSESFYKASRKNIALAKQAHTKYIHEKYGDPKTRIDKVCAKCQTRKKIKFFRMNGVDSYCLPCRRTIDREFARAKREKIKGIKNEDR